MSAHDVGKEATAPGGGAVKKGANKAVGKASKYLKKLLIKLMKQIVISIGKALFALIGWEGVLIIAICIIVLATLTAIPGADWYLGGNARSEDQQEADGDYQQEFVQAAKDTVADLYAIKADKSWINQLVSTVRPSWGIPAALVQYEILVQDNHVEYSDYDPDDLISRFKPTFKYNSITEDKEWIKTKKICPTENGQKTTVNINETKREKHSVLSDVYFEYGEMAISPLTRYYPGETLKRTDKYEFVEKKNAGDCVVETYRQYQDTQVDDRFVPLLSIDKDKFKAILIDLGVDEKDMKLYFEFVLAADSDWDKGLYDGTSEVNTDWNPGTAKVPEVVLRYEPIVRKYLEQHGMGDYTQLLLALIMQETGGRYLDVMQSSESLGMKPNTLTDPELSIQQGVNHFVSVFNNAKASSGKVDIELTLQSYNFGGGYIAYAKAHGGHSKENAVAFSKQEAAKKGWKRYGDVDYVEHVMRYYNDSNQTINIAPGQQIFDVQQALNIMSQYMGMPYKFGGKSPATRFDCSGLLSYSFAQIGINLSGSARDQYNKTAKVSAADARPGDLVFWETWRSGPSHVGMYLGNDKMINASSSRGVSIGKVSTWNKLYKGFGFRRIVSR